MAKTNTTKSLGRENGLSDEQYVKEATAQAFLNLTGREKMSRHFGNMLAAGISGSTPEQKKGAVAAVYTCRQAGGVFGEKWGDVFTLAGYVLHGLSIWNEQYPDEDDRE